ncbi:MAG: PHP-associated domain-containing protein, partial [Anaerolineae bacterium]
MTPFHTGKADIHIHSNHSDGSAGIRQILEYVQNHTDLNVVAIADHDTLHGSLTARDIAHEYGLEAIPAMEVSSKHGHILALWVERPVPPNLPADETIARIHEQGGIAIAAHAVEPFSASLLAIRPHVLAPWRLKALGVDGLEAFNASITIPPMEWVARLAAEWLGVAVTGGSDAHYLGTIGRGITLFPGHTAADLKTALLERRTVPAGARYALKHYAG